MTGAADDGQPSTDAGAPRLSAADIVPGLAASLVWATLTFVGLGDARSAAAGMVALGCASSSAVPLAMLARVLGWPNPVAAAVEATALVALVPVALFASAIQTHTHHRALGAVTFAVGATLVFGVSFPIVRRILGEADAGVLRWRLLRGALRALSVVSVAWILWTLAGSGHRDRVQCALVDGSLGLAILVLSARVPRTWLPRVLVRAAPAVLVVFLGGAAVASWKNALSCAILCERAPVTLGIPGVFACR